MNTTSSNGLLVPRPPNLFHVAERQAFSRSSASFSSTSSSSTSAGFGRYSRNSSGSAYLTDLTPPISPSQSRCDIKSAGDDYEAGKSISSSLAENLIQSGQEQSDHIDDKVALCSNMRAPRDQGYSAASESEEITCDTFAASSTKLGRASQSINTRRALQIMERRAKPKSGPVENVPRMPSLSSKVVITELGVHGVEDWSEAFGATCVVQQTSSPPSDHASEASIVKGSQGSLEDSSDYAAQSSQSSIQDDSFFRSPRIPSKPVIRPTELNQDCSPLSLYSQDFSSCMSVSLLLLSPPDLDASNALSSPAIYNESFAHANSPLSSPVHAISSRMFSSRISHRTPSDALTGEDLDIAALMHLETAAGLGMGMHSTPNRRTSALSAQVPLPLDCPYYEESWEAKDDPSFSRRQAEAILSNADDYGLPSNHELSGPLVDIQRRIEQGDQPVIGLGLGQLAESSLCSSSSISRLYSATNATLEVNEECANDRRSSPAVKSIVADPKIEPLGALFHQSSYAATATEDLSLSPISNLPQKRLPRPPRRNERKPEVNAAPVIDPSALQANSHVLASNPKSIQSYGSAKHKSQDPSHMTDEEVDVVAFLDQDPVGVLDKYADISDLQLRHLPLQHPRSAHDDKLAESHVIEQRSALREKGSYKSPPPGSASFSHKLGDNGAQKNGVPVRLSGLPALDTDSKSTQKPKLEVKLGTCGYTHRSFPLPSFQPYRDPPAYKAVSLRPKPTFLHDCRRDDSPPGSPPFLLTPENDPRSPCSPSSHISRRQSAISGSSFSSQGLSAGSSNGTSASPSAEQAASVVPSSNSSFPGDSAELSVAAGLKESKSADSVGIGLPSDLASRPPRQRELSTSSIVGLTDSMEYGLLPTTASCQNLAQLAAGSSPDLNTPAAEGGADEFINLEDSRPLSKFTRFAQRCLSAIPEQTTPSPTILSPCRLRIATPFSPPSSPTWADFSVFTRLRSPRSPSRLSSSARIPSPLAESSEAPTNDNFCPSIEDVKTSSVNAKNLFRKYFRGGKESTRGPESAPMMDVPQTPPSSPSPGIVEHPNAPKGLKIFKRHRQAQLPGSTGRRPRSPLRRFQVLF